MPFTSILKHTVAVNGGYSQEKLCLSSGQHPALLLCASCVVRVFVDVAEVTSTWLLANGKANRVFRGAGAEPTKHRFNFEPVPPQCVRCVSVTWFWAADSLGGSSSSRISHLLEELPATHTPEDTQHIQRLLEQTPDRHHKKSRL